MHFCKKTLGVFCKNNLSGNQKNNIMRTVLLIYSLAVLNVFSATAQDETRFFAEANRAELAVGEPLSVTFQLENGQNSSRIAPVDWESAGFMVLGSSQSSSISIIDGQTSTTAAYQFNVTPFEAGTRIIPSATIRSGEQELHTDPISIQVLPSPDGTSPRSKPLKKPEYGNPRVKTIKM